MASIPYKVQKRYTIRDFIKRDNLNLQRKKFMIRGELEIKTIKNSKHIIGRTVWDKTCTKFMNPNAIYHFCNENLRGVFYNKRWSDVEHESYTI